MREKFLMIRAFKFTLDGPPIHALLINTFDIGLLAWETNIDTQPAFDYHKAITYMWGYLSKQEGECSEVMKQAFKKSLEREQDAMNKWNQ